MTTTEMLKRRGTALLASRDPMDVLDGKDMIAIACALEGAPNRLAEEISDLRAETEDRHGAWELDNLSDDLRRLEDRVDDIDERLSRLEAKR